MKENKLQNLISFIDGDININGNVFNRNSIWMSKKDLSILFGVPVDNISLHIKSIYKNKELDETTCKDSLQVYIKNKKEIKRHIKLYNFDMLLALGYKVKSKKGYIFRKWASKVLDDHLIKGYSINQRRLDVLNKAVEIQTKALGGSLEDDVKDVDSVINQYASSLSLLDDYDHHVLSNTKGHKVIYQITYKECRDIINKIAVQFNSQIFGKEKEDGKLEGIILNIYQNVFGKEVYDTLENKAAHLLYFLIKDHPFVDGCKRIAATLFLTFLYKNNNLKRNGELIIPTKTLGVLTLFIAESNPDEMDIVINVILRLLETN